MWIVNGRLVNVAWIIEVTFKSAFGAWVFGFGTIASSALLCTATRGATRA